MDSLLLNISLFCVSGIIIWYCSNKLSDIVDYVDGRFKLGAAFGGTIILSIATNLPELAIVVQGVLQQDTSLAIGNILGGIALQTILLSLFDFASGKNEQRPFSTLVGHPVSILQGVFLVSILAFVIMGTQFNKTKISPDFPVAEIFIFIFWLLSLYLLHKGKKTIGTPPATEINEKVIGIQLTPTKALILLAVLSTCILIFGYLLGVTSDALANHYHIDGVIFGATILAFVTSLPEISGGLAFIKQKSYQPIISDIFGGNAFLPVLFLIASIINHNTLLPDAGHSDIYLTALSIILTCIYLIGILLKPKKRILGMGIDSWFAFIIYIIGIICITIVA